MLPQRGLLWGKQQAQRRPAARQTRLHRAEVHIQYLRDLLVCEAFDLAQHDYRAESLRHLTQRRFHTGAQLVAYCLVKRRDAAVRQHPGQGQRLAVGLGIALRTARCIHRYLLLAVALPPAALIGSLMYRYAVQPCAQARITMEAPNIAEDLDEDLLRNVRGVRGVLQTARDPRIKRLVVLGNQFSKRALRSGTKFRDKGRLFSR